MLEYTDKMWFILLLAGTALSIDEYGIATDEIVKKFAKDFVSLRNIGRKHDLLSTLFTNYTVVPTSTPKPKKFLTQEKFYKLSYLRCMRELQDLMSLENEKPDVANLDNHIEKIKKEMEEIAPNISRRHGTHQYELDDYIEFQKFQIQDLSEYQIFRTQPYLIEVQQAIKYYVRFPRFKLGYVMAFVKNLKQQQRMIYSVLADHKREVTTIHTYVMMYGKILRLDRDIRDMVFFMKDMYRKIRDAEYVEVKEEDNKKLED